LQQYARAVGAEAAGDLHFFVASGTLQAPCRATLPARHGEAIVLRQLLQGELRPPRPVTLLRMAREAAIGEVDRLPPPTGEIR